jgi:glycosyltransferase involved in cell wall biosynthesis
MYFSTGETVGTPAAPFPNCGVTWHYTPTGVYLPAWPLTRVDSTAPYTTVSSWWGWWEVFQGETFNNEKRISFLEYLDLPKRTSVKLELALSLWDLRDHEDVLLLETNSWKVRHAFDVGSTPEQYRDYLGGSRGEFSCAKPSCMRLQNAWVSDRSLCYMAMGKPAVVQDTGPSRFLPDADGLFRFRSMEGAVQALADAEADYERHSRQARALVEEYFDAEKVIGKVLERALA